MSDLPQVSLSGEVGIPPGNMSVSLINEGVCVCPCTRVGVWVCMYVCCGCLYANLPAQNVYDCCVLILLNSRA